MTTIQPSEAALRWAGGGTTPARVVRSLAGGTHAVTHLLEGGSPEREMVLRRFPDGDDAAVREAAALRALGGLDGWAPELIDVDPDGGRVGAPATLISRIPGRADLTSMGAAQAAEQLGRVLARVHAVPLDRFGELRDGVAAAAEHEPDRRLSGGEPVLTHYDFWSGNVLWQGREITGVVDWSGACRAPRGFDVSWCRLDLVLLHGKAAAEIFLAAYQQAAGVVVPDIARWDLFASTNSRDSVETWLPNYADLGRTDLTAAALRARHTAWAHHCTALQQ